ncbi:MAG: phosphatidylglycerol lysyltransferase domain-containing protein [Eubacteriaceae bacterium]|jgi:hypothetical protein|nr:phosphatidylglycerol lysyltransferase domain-containing protein [Eubacteriaceae bacterium]
MIFKNKVTLGCKDEMEQYLNAVDHRTSGLSFSSLYMWREINEFSWEVINGYMCVEGISHLELEEGVTVHFMNMPLSPTGEYDSFQLRECVLECKKRFEDAGQLFTMRLIPYHLTDTLYAAFPDELVYISDRANYDYMYHRTDLVELKGRAYHQKKNHLNYFLKNYIYEYRKLTSDDAQEALEFLDSWEEGKADLPADERHMLELEQKAMGDVLGNLETVGYFAGAIYIDGEMKAMSIGGQLNRKTVTCHVEKADASIRGLYPAITKEFCAHLPEYIRYINREEDMDLPNLRKAKMAYKPCRMIEKYIVNFKSDRKAAPIAPVAWEAVGGK